MSNGNDKAANIQRILNVAQTSRTIFGGEAPEKLVFKDDVAIQVAYEIVGKARELALEEALAIIEDADQAVLDNATNAYLEDEPGSGSWDDDRTSKFLYGHGVGEDADVTLFVPDFTAKNVDTLVNEVTNKWAGIIGVTDRAAISETLRPIVEGSLYKHWTIDDGRMVQGAPTVITGISPIWEDALKGIYQNMDLELLEDPRHLLRTEKVELVLESMVLADIITPLQKGFVLFPERLLSTQEREELGEGLGAASTEAAISALTEMMGNVVQFADDNFDNAFNRMTTMPSVGTLAEAFDFFVGEDLKKPLLDSSLPTPEGGWRRLPPIGFDEVTLRQAEYQERLLAAYGQEGKKFNDQVTDLMRQLDIETDASLVVGKTEKAATKFANARFREDLDKVAEEARAAGRTNFEVFQAVNDAAIAFMEQGQYQEVFSQHSEFITQHDLSTPSGSEKFIKDNYSEARDLTKDQLGNLSDALIGAGSRSEADAIIRERLGDALRASYQLGDAKEDFNKWYLDETGRDPSSLDKGVLAQWQRNVYQAGGIDNLLRWEKQNLTGIVGYQPAILPDGSRAPDILEPGDDEVAKSLLDSIESVNTAALNRARLEETLKVSEGGKFKGLEQLAFNLAVDNDIISASSNPQFYQHFVTETVPAMVEAAAWNIGDFETLDDVTGFFLSEFGVGPDTDRRPFPIRDRAGLPFGEEVAFIEEAEPEAVIGAESGITSIDISETAFNEFMFPEPGATGATLNRSERLDIYNRWKYAQQMGQGVTPSGAITPFTAGQRAMGMTQSLEEALADRETQLDPGQIPAFPEGFGTPFDIPSPEEVKKSSDIVLERRRKEEAALDFARIQEQMGDDMAGPSFEEYYKERETLAELSATLDVERLAQAGRTAQDPLYSPGATGDPERIRAIEEQIAKLQPFSDQMEKARRERLREAEDWEYVQEQARLRRMPQRASATQFAKAIREAAPDDIGFQQFLLGESAEIQAGFKGTAGTPLDFSEYFVGITPGLRQRFGETPQGVASELMRFEREEQEGERLEREAEREDIESERERRRSLRGRGRTELRI